MVNQEAYTPVRMTTSGVVTSDEMNIAGFLCTVSGTLQLRRGSTISGDIIVGSMPVTAGVYHPIPFSIGGPVYAELTTAEGTFAVFS